METLKHRHENIKVQNSFNEKSNGTLLFLYDVISLILRGSVLYFLNFQNVFGVYSVKVDLITFVVERELHKMV